MVTHPIPTVTMVSMVTHPIPTVTMVSMVTLFSVYTNCQQGSTSNKKTMFQRTQIIHKNGRLSSDTYSQIDKVN